MMDGVTAEEYQNLMLSVGTHQSKRRLSPVEVARLIAKSMASGMTRRRCAAVLGIGSTQVSVFLKLMDLADDIQHLADWRGTENAAVPFSTLAELARLNAGDQVEAAAAVLRYSLTWKEVVQLVQIAKRSDNNIDECIANVVKLRPTVTTQYLFVGAITDKGLLCDLQGMAQTQLDQLLEQALATFTDPVIATKSRLGLREFTILSDHDLRILLDLDADELEQIVNESLRTLRTVT
jgi:hypothetical protein